MTITCRGLHKFANIHNYKLKEKCVLHQYSTVGMKQKALQIPSSCVHINKKLFSYKANTSTVPYRVYELLLYLICKHFVVSIRQRSIYFQLKLMQLIWPIFSIRYLVDLPISFYVLDKKLNIRSYWFVNL